ncbi:MAG: sigma-70 family RNA polymerase sigma factor [Gordonibacter sp.]|uniref:RNA polymerase sigma factor n=1 Tax=Gordonibacter sp. TaxID=1968902 RepID=UPI002FC9C7BE
MLSNNDIAATFRRHMKTVYRLCFSFLGNAADAEDATQSVFMKLIDRPHRFNDVEHEKAWLIVCAQNHCRDVLKSPARKRVVELSDDVADERVRTDPALVGEALESTFVVDGLGGTSPSTPCTVHAYPDAAYPYAVRTEGSAAYYLAVETSK